MEPSKATERLRGIVNVLDITMNQAKSNFRLSAPKSNTKRSWVVHVNCLTLQYNWSVHSLDPKNMPKGDLLSHNRNSDKISSSNDNHNKRRKMSKWRIGGKDDNEKKGNRDDIISSKNEDTSEPSMTDTSNPNERKIKVRRKRKRYVNVSVKHVQDIQDLIDIIDNNPLEDDVKYDIDVGKLHSISKPLRKLNGMIGLSSLKTNIIHQILYFMQDLHKANDGTDNMDYMHTVIYGPPGTGKTEVATIIGQIYANLGILKKSTFRKVTRSDLVAGYLGQTALKTKKVIEQALDGVLFIDEAYSLGNSEKRDSYSKECIDTLCESASYYKDRLLIIIAGYEEELNSCFFSYNKGLDSRFPWRYETEKYNNTELAKIYNKMIKDINWSTNITITTLASWFDDNKDSFEFFGRDMETLLSKTKVCHATRVFGKPKNERRILTLDDIQRGLEMFKKHRQKDDITTIRKDILTAIYT